jgi:DNA-binding CsgD family transcriptional regulator
VSGPWPAGGTPLENDLSRSFWRGGCADPIVAACPCGGTPLSGALLVTGEIEVWLGHAAGGSWAGAVTVAAASLVLLLRRRAPVRCAAAVLVIQAVCALWAEPDAMTFGLISIVAWYTVGRWANPRHALIALGAVCVVAIGMVVPGSGVDWLNMYLSVTLTGFGVPWLVGLVVRTRADSVDRRDSRSALDSSRTGDETSVGGASDLASLSPREREVFGLLADGATNTEIADRLFLSVYTVKSHVASILAKLGLRDRVQVVLYAHHPAALTGSETPGGAPSSSA